MSTRPQRPGSALGWMTCSSLGFAVMTALVKQLSLRLSQFWLVELRTAMTALIFLVVLLVKKQEIWPSRGKGLLAFRGLAGFGGIACLFYGSAHLPLAVATLLNWCSLVFVLFFSAAFLREALPFRAVLWTAVSVAGLILLVKPGISSGPALPVVALSVGLLGALFSAMAMTAVRAATARFSAELIIFHFSALAALISLPLALQQEAVSAVTQWILASRAHALSVLALGVSGSLAQYAMTRGYAAASAGLGSTLSLLTSAFSAVIGWWFFDELLSPAQWMGVSLLALGVLMAGASSAFANRRGARLAQTPEIS